MICLFIYVCFPCISPTVDLYRSIFPMYIYIHIFIFHQDLFFVQHIFSLTHTHIYICIIYVGEIPIGFLAPPMDITNCNHTGNHRWYHILRMVARSCTSWDSKHPVIFWVSTVHLVVQDFATTHSRWIWLI